MVELVSWEEIVVEIEKFIVSGVSVVLGSLQITKDKKRSETRETKHLIDQSGMEHLLTLISFQCS